MEYKLFKEKVIAAVNAGGFPRVEMVAVVAKAIPCDNYTNENGDLVIVVEMDVKSVTLKLSE